METPQRPNRDYRIIIDQRPFTWHEPMISGTQIKQLAGVDPSYGVWQELPGPTDPLVEDTEVVDLTKPGVERFFTGKKDTTEGR